MNEKPSGPPFGWVLFVAGFLGFLVAEATTEGWTAAAPATALVGEEGDDSADHYANDEQPQRVHSLHRFSLL